ncbi:MAG: DUF2127 domain-containing protein [Candidatus Acidiferrales bacterium]
MQRPIGVTFIACIFLLGALLLMFNALQMLFDPRLLARIAASSSRGGPPVPGMGSAIGTILLVAAGIAALNAIGLWMLKNWARILSICISAIVLVLAIPELFLDLSNPIALLGALLRIIISPIIIVYLLNPRVKQAFGV